MGNVARPFRRRRGGFAQVVHQAGKAHFQWRLHLRGAAQHHHHVHAGVDFGVVFGRLGHAPLRVHLGQHHGQCAAVAQHVKHARGLVFHQALGQLLPHALGHQVRGFTHLHHIAQQIAGVVGHVELRKARGKARQAQDAHRVFGKGGAGVAQQARGQIALAATGVYQGRYVGRVAAIGQRQRGHGVDAQVAPGQVFF